jgi:uncharacterized protein (UPF0335 family)
MAKRKGSNSEKENDALEFTPSVVQSVIKRIEALNDEKDSARGRYMNQCAKLNERINAIIDEGSRKGIPAKGVRAAVKLRAKNAKLLGELNKHEAEEREVIQTILQVNDDPNDLPLWKAATARGAASKSSGEGAALN